MDIEKEYQQSLKSLFVHYGQTFSPGTRIIREGEESSEVYFLLSGMASVFFGENPEEHVLWMMQPGDFVGEMALLDNLPRSASVEILEETQAVVLDRDSFYQLISNHPALSLRIIRTMGMRMRKLDAKYKRYLGYAANASADE